MKYIEVEQKYALPEPDSLREALTALGGRALPGVRQVDAYYNAPHRDFLGPDVVSEWLRVRENATGTASINYKLWHPVEATLKTHADEHESTIGDAQALHKTLDALGFTAMVTVDKTREEWTVPNAPVLIAIDTLANVGSFAEFEYKGDAETVEDATGALDLFITDLGIKLGDRIDRGYPHIILGRDT